MNKRTKRINVNGEQNGNKIAMHKTHSSYAIDKNGIAWGKLDG